MAEDGDECALGAGIFGAVEQWHGDKFFARGAAVQQCFGVQHGEQGAGGQRQEPAGGGGVGDGAGAGGGVPRGGAGIVDGGFPVVIHLAQGEGEGFTVLGFPGHIVGDGFVERAVGAADKQGHVLGGAPAGAAIHDRKAHGAGGAGDVMGADLGEGEVVNRVLAGDGGGG